MADAFQILCEELHDADILQVNGAFDPVASNAAAAVGVQGFVEVMHQVETGGLDESLDAVVCVSELVQSVQSHNNTIVIHNGIDTDRFSFIPERRSAGGIQVVQVSNSAKVLHCELGDMAAGLDDPSVELLMVGSRAAVPGCRSVGVVADMPTVYHAADLLFLVEKRSAFGLVFAEAMACGALPIVSGDSCAVAFVRHGETGWVVDPPSPENALQTLRTAIDTVRTPKFLAMQCAARQLVEARFSKETMLAGYQNLWLQLAKQPKKPPREPAAWMNLALFAKLFRSGAPHALHSLEEYLADPRPLEAYFLRHPIGLGTVAVILQSICPEMLRCRLAPLVFLLCARLRNSRCASPLLDELESQAKKLRGK